MGAVHSLDDKRAHSELNGLRADVERLTNELGRAWQSERELVEELAQAHAELKRWQAEWADLEAALSQLVALGGDLWRHCGYCGRAFRGAAPACPSHRSLLYVDTRAETVELDPSAEHDMIAQLFAPLRTDPATPEAV